MEEIWKDIDGYEGKYKISNYGRVKSLQRVSKNGAKIKERILNPSPQKNGYVQVHLSTDDGYRWELVHRLVANAFLRRKTESDCIVNHLDNNPSNNKLDNLEWTTYKGNMQWAAKQGRMRCKHDNIKKAIEKRKTAIIATDSDGNKLLFDSQKEAAKVLGVHSGHISKLCRKEYGYKQSRGYTFEYADKKIQESAIPNRVKMPYDERIEKLRSRMVGNQYGKGRKVSDKNKLASKIKLGKPICQYDKEGNFIKEYMCSEDVVRESGITHSDDVANGKRKTAGGYIWRWKETL